MKIDRPKNIQEKLKYIRKKVLEMNQTEFGQLVGGVSTATISNYESGICVPTIELIENLYLKARIEPNDIFDYIENNPVRIENCTHSEKAQNTV